MLVEGPDVWITKMAYWLPYHQDRFFIGINHAFAGAYENRFTDDLNPKRKSDPKSLLARANRELDRFSRRAHDAIARYRANRHKR